MLAIEWRRADGFDAMKLEASAFDDYYASAAGMAVCGCIGRRLTKILPSPKAHRVLGFGYAEPYLAAAPSALDVAFCRPPALAPLTRGGAIPPMIMKDDFVLPYGDDSFDDVLVVHGLEMAVSARQLLRQLWRVLVLQGRLILVVPNRQRFWGRIRHCDASWDSAFSLGHAYRRAELEALLCEALFECKSWDCALYCPPRVLEALGRAFFPNLAGVHIVVAKKTLCTTPLRAQSEAMSGIFARA